MTNANDRQVGGSHYRPKKPGALQHWDIIEGNGVGYLEGYATKYLTRCMISGKTVQDLEKARHCIEKLIELANKPIAMRMPTGPVPDDVLRQFFSDNAIDNQVQRIAITLILQWRSTKQLEMALSLICYLLGVATAMDKLEEQRLTLENPPLERMVPRHDQEAGAPIRLGRAVPHGYTGDDN